VGTHGLANWFTGDVDVQTAQDQWTQFHLATLDVFWSDFREKPREDGKIYLGKPLKSKTRKELIANLRPNYLQYLRADNGDLPEGYTPPPQKERLRQSLQAVS